MCTAAAGCLALLGQWMPCAVADDIAAQQQADVNSLSELTAQKQQTLIRENQYLQLRLRELERNYASAQGEAADHDLNKNIHVMLAAQIGFKNFRSLEQLCRHA